MTSVAAPVPSPVLSAAPATEPPPDCPLCPRLVAFRHDLRAEHPGWWNAPVPAWGDPDAWLGIVGLAPGKHGANRTGRPFTGDFAGLLLFEALLTFGLATGSYEPTPEEIRTCRPYLEAPIAALPRVRVFVALGQIAHQSAVKALGGRLPKAPFGHLAEHVMPDGRVLIDSYHCSRYNQNTGKLTRAMFEAVFARALAVGETV